MRTELCNCSDFGKINRELAMSWWKDLSKPNKIHYAVMYKLAYKSLSSLTGREIEFIWSKETSGNFSNIPDELTHENYDYTSFPMNPNPSVPNFITGKPQVDFEVIKNYDEILTHLEDISEDMCEKAKNFKLFFDIISKSSSFAHKAHKELKNK